MFEAKLVKYKTTAAFGSITIGSVVNVFKLFQFSGKEALLYAPRYITGKLSCIFPATYDRDNDYYICKNDIIYLNEQDFMPEINAILGLYKFPKPPPKKELEAIKLLKNAGYKVTKE